MAPIDFNGLDTHVHGPIRLGILTALQMDGALDFTTLKKRLETADGSLNLHLRRLEENGYITSRKAFVGLRPKTTYRMTPTGRKALTGYVKAMRQLLEVLNRVPDSRIAPVANCIWQVESGSGSTRLAPTSPLSLTRKLLRTIPQLFALIVSRTSQVFASRSS